MEPLPASVHALGPLLVVLGVSLICGGALGFERELQHKAAGLKTIVLICVGSALYATLARLMLGGLAGADPTRVVGQVVTGIGFLGGGAILHAEGIVVGLTSAAVIWVVAAIGLFIGTGYPVLAVVATAAVLLILVALRTVEERFLPECERRHVTVRFADDGGRTRAAIAGALERNGVGLHTVTFEHRGDAYELRIPCCQSHVEHRRFLSDLWQMPGVHAVDA